MSTHAATFGFIAIVYIKSREEEIEEPQGIIRASSASPNVISLVCEGTRPGQWLRRRGTRSPHWVRV